MGLRFRKTFGSGKGPRLHLSKSGISVSQKIGRTTFNTRGRATTNLGGGFSIQHGGGRTRRGKQAAPQPMPREVAPAKKTGCLGCSGRTLVLLLVVAIVVVLVAA